MDKQLFRQKSLDRISSPEELHDYMRVTSPRLWMILATILALLVGFIVYAATTRMETTETIMVRSYFGDAFGTVPKGRQDLIKPGMPVRIGGKTGKIGYTDHSIQYQLNISLDSDKPLEEGGYYISFGENGDVTSSGIGWPESEATEEDPDAQQDSSASRDNEQSGNSGQESPDGNDDNTHQPIYVEYSENGFTLNAYTNEETLQMFRNGDVRVRIWKFDYSIEDGQYSLTEGRLATVSGYSTITVTTATVIMDDQSEPLPNGTYEATVVTESTTPLSFLWN